jgi:hypothetical protein
MSAFRGKSGHRSRIAKCPLMTQSGHGRWRNVRRSGSRIHTTFDDCIQETAFLENL